MWCEADDEYKVGGVKAGSIRAKPRFSFNEVKTLLEAVMMNRFILLKKFNSGVAAEAKKQCWVEITEHINSLGENRREVRQIMKKWADLKCDGKRRILSLRGRHMRKKKLGPIEKMVQKIITMVPNADSDLDNLEEEDGDVGVANLYRRRATSHNNNSSSGSYGNANANANANANVAPYSYLSLNDSSNFSLPGGASFEMSPLSSPEKDPNGHSSDELEFGDDGELLMDYNENDDSLFTSFPTSSSTSTSCLEPLPGNSNPLLRLKPVHTYSRSHNNSHNNSHYNSNNSQSLNDDNGGQSQIHSYSKPPLTTTGPSTAIDTATDSASSSSSSLVTAANANPNETSSLSISNISTSSNPNPNLNPNPNPTSIFILPNTLGSLSQATIINPQTSITNPSTTTKPHSQPSPSSAISATSMNSQPNSQASTAILSSQKLPKPSFTIVTSSVNSQKPFATSFSIQTASPGHLNVQKTATSALPNAQKPAAMSSVGVLNAQKQSTNALPSFSSSVSLSQASLRSTNTLQSQLNSQQASQKPTYTQNPPPPPHNYNRINNSNSNSLSSSSFLHHNSKAKAPNPFDPLPPGASNNTSSSSSHYRDNLRQMSNESLAQQKAGRELLSSVSQSMENLAQTVQMLSESQQQFVSESLSLQRQTVEVLRDFSSTTLKMLREKR